MTTLQTLIDEKQLAMMKHAWGFDSKSPGYRTHYCTSLTDLNMQRLVELSYFKGPVAVGLVGDGHGIFHLTARGIEALKNIVRGEG